MFPERNKAVMGWYVWRVKGDSQHVYGPAKPRVSVELESGPHGPYNKEGAEAFCNKINNRGATKCN